MLIIAIPESSSEDQTTCLLLALFLSVFLLLAPICSPHNVVSLHSKKHPPVSLSLLLLCKLLFYFSLSQQATTSSTIAPLSKHCTSDHQHGRPCLLQLVPCMERGPPTLLGCCQLLQNAPFQCYKKTLKKTTSLRLLRGGLHTHHHFNLYIKYTTRDNNIVFT